jgi:hypothetical protein
MCVKVEARTIAKEAYLYDFTLLDNYRIMCDDFVDQSSPDYKSPFKQIKNMPCRRTRSSRRSTPKRPNRWWTQTFESSLNTNM